MSQGLSAPGVGLPVPQNLYPSFLNNAPADPSSNRVTLQPGGTLVIPAGNWFISVGSYMVLQYLDPITNTWTRGPAAAWNNGFQYIKSDGFTTRIANLTGCVDNIVVTAYGTAWVQATTTLTITGPSNATAVPLVGGQLTLVGGTLSNSGAGYGKPPIVFIPPPPPAASNVNGIGGIQASAYAVIASGTVSGITFTNPGAGYPSAPTPVLVPDPTDPNISTGITQATAAFSLIGSGSITGALVTNHGSPLADGSTGNVTVTPSGAGSAATLTANIMQTVKAGSVVGTGLGYGTVGVLLSTTGGGGNLGTITNGPDMLGLAFRPRPAQINLAVTAGGTLAGQVGTVIDGGLFLGVPNAVIQTNPLPGANVTVSGATISLVMGSRPDIAIIQPAA